MEVPDYQVFGYVGLEPGVGEGVEGWFSLIRFSVGFLMSRLQVISDFHSSGMCRRLEHMEGVGVSASGGTSLCTWQ